MSKGHVLVIDDEPTLLEACEETLSYHGYDVRLQATARDGVESVRQETFDLVLIDLRMPDTDGLHILREIRSIDENVMTVMITGFPTIATAVEAVKEGAFDYLPKPFTPDQLLIVVDRALSQKRLTEENLLLRKTLRFRRGFAGMVGKSRAMERVISATNENLEQMVADGRFRDDLYYRLNVITIPLPPLRERVEDIPLLTEHVLKSLNSEHKKYVQGISKETINLLQGYAWPGNVRELQNVIERAFFLTDAEEITPLDLPAHLTRQETPVLPVDTQLPFPQAKRAYLEPFEREYLAKLLLDCGGNVSRAVERAQVHRSSFQRLLKKHGIRPRDYRGA